MTHVIDAIKTRRSARRLKDIAPDRDTISKVLEAASWAPNHHLTEPWRFVVIAGDERKRLGDAMAEYVRRSAEKSSDSAIESKINNERVKPLRAPVIISLICSPRDNAMVQEEVVACGAALQNILLAAHSLGLGVMIKTGSSSYSDEVRQLLKMSSQELLIGMIYLGYHAEPPPAGKRTTLESKTVWLGF